MQWVRGCHVKMSPSEDDKSRSFVHHPHQPNCLDGAAAASFPSFFFFSLRCQWACSSASWGHTDHQHVSHPPPASSTPDSQQPCKCRPPCRRSKTKGASGSSAEARSRGCHRRGGYKAEGGPREGIKALAKADG